MDRATTAGHVAIEIIYHVEERLPNSEQWHLLHHIRPMSEEEADAVIFRLSRSMPRCEFRRRETRYDPLGIEDDDIPF